jgi:hypothetical protein
VPGFSLMMSGDRLHADSGDGDVDEVSPDDPDCDRWTVRLRGASGGRATLMVKPIKAGGIAVFPA